MKKIISLVVMATMLCTLFAVNVSAAVPFGSKTVELIDVADFESGNAWVPAAMHNDYVADVTNTIVNVEGRGNVLNMEIGSNIKGAVAYGVPLWEDNADVTALPTKYNVEFDIKAVAIPVTFVVHASRGTADMEVRLAPDGFEVGDWYHYVITFDESTTDENAAMTVKRKNITDNGGWQICEPVGTSKTCSANAPSWSIDYFTVENGGYRAQTTGITGGGSFGAYGNSFLLFGTMSGKADGYSEVIGDRPGSVYQLDNVVITKDEAIPTENILVTENYEGAGTLFNNAPEGKTEIVTVDGSACRRLYTTAAEGSRWMHVSATANDGLLMPRREYTIQFDIKAVSESEGFGLAIFSDKKTYGSRVRLNNIPLNTWYTYRVINVDSEFTVIRKARGTNTWETVEAAYDGTYRASGGTDDKGAYVSANGNNSQGTIAFVSYVFDATFKAASDYYIDNIVIANAPEQFALTDAKVANNELTVEMAFEDSAQLDAATLTPVLATFAGGTLIDVDFEAATADKGLISAELSASVAGANKAELYVWDGIGTAKPVKAAAYDLSSYLD